MEVPMTSMEATGWTIASLGLILALWLFYSFIIYPKQYAKNKSKQEAKERAEIDKLFSEAKPQRKADRYNDFTETPMMATSL